MHKALYHSVICNCKKSEITLSKPWHSYTIDDYIAKKNAMAWTNVCAIMLNKNSRMQSCTYSKELNYERTK